MIRIGTRGSLLAMRQAHEVADKLSAQHQVSRDAFEIVEINTSGDRIQDRPLSEVGGKGLFTKEIEQALFDRRIDVAVHSLKDVETAPPEGTDLAAILPREDVRDVFISRKFASVRDMPAGARLGTSSIRRRSQALFLNPGIELVDFRGNVQTRLDKLANGVADATFLARAGLNRLGYMEDYFHDVPIAEMLPAAAQGAIGLQIRRDDDAAREAVAPLNHEATALCVTAERAFLAKLDGSCRTPIAGLAELRDGQIHFRGEVFSLDGKQCRKASRQGDAAAAVRLAVEASEEIKASLGDDFF